jgi:hypothetical protein
MSGAGNLKFPSSIGMAAGFVELQYWHWENAMLSQLDCVHVQL